MRLSVPSCDHESISKSSDPSISVHGPIDHKNIECELINDFEIDMTKPNNLLLSPIKRKTKQNHYSLTMSPNLQENIVQFLINNNNNSNRKHKQSNIDSIRTFERTRSSDSSIYIALNASLKYLDEMCFNNSLLSLKFSNNNSILESNFSLYFAHRYLLSNQAAFLLFSIFYIVILFIFDVSRQYEWISIVVHCILIIFIFCGLFLSLTDRFKTCIHRITAVIVLVVLIGLNIQSGLAKVPISAQSVLTLELVLLACAAYLSLRYNDLLIVFVIFLVFTNLSFIFYNQISHNFVFTHFLWFNVLLIFGMVCTCHLVRAFELQERKLFMKILQEIKQCRAWMKRDLTVSETICIAQMIENDRNGFSENQYFLDKVLKQFVSMAGLFQHLPVMEHEQQRTSDDLDYCDGFTTDDGIQSVCESDSSISTELGDLREFETENGFENKKICKLTQLPSYYNGYPFIPNGYRLHYTYKQALWSIFEWHNESINMWTEIVPFALNLIYLVFTCFSNEQFLNEHALVVSAIVILLVRPVCSLLAHTFYLISSSAHDFWWRLDYTSICVTMLCEGIVSGNYTFKCDYQLRLLFFTCLICMFISTMLSTLFSKSMQIRAANFCLFVMFATGCPFLYQWINIKNIESNQYLLVWSCAYVLAAAAIIIKSAWFPERCCVHKSNKHKNCISYVGASHQIWHILVNISLFLSIYCWCNYIETHHNC